MQYNLRTCRTRVVKQLFYITLNYNNGHRYELIELCEEITWNGSIYPRVIIEIVDYHITRQQSIIIDIDYKQFI